MICLTLPYGPSANVYWRSDRRGLPHLSDEARAYKRQVRLLAFEAGVQPLQGEVGLRVFFYRPQRSGDIDGRIKPLLDAMNRVTYVDDKQIVELHVYRREDRERPRAEVQIWSVKLAHVQEALL